LFFFTLLNSCSPTNTSSGPSESDDKFLDLINPSDAATEQIDLGNRVVRYHLPDNVDDNNRHETLEYYILKSKEAPFPIVIAPFEIINDLQENIDIAKIIRDNLNRSGQFSASNTDTPVKNEIDFDYYWRKNKIDAFVFGFIESVNGNKDYTVEIYIYDVFSKKLLYGKKIEFLNVTSVRRLAHIISDKIYNVLLGQKGSFDTMLSYVTDSINSKTGKKTYRIQISDVDGFNPKTIVEQSQAILSPVWSIDFKVAYVSFEDNRSKVYVKDLLSEGNPIILHIFDGIASSPTWHPDGKSIALTLSESGNKDIYLYNLEFKTLTRLTTHFDIDTEANFSPDGKSIAFTSKRTGQVQVYIKNLKSGKISRATFEGRYNANPVFSPDGKDLALIHRVGKDYRLALLDIASRDLTVLTQNKSDESPYFSPNGGMIIFSTNRDNKEILSIISLHNNQIVELSGTNYFNERIHANVKFPSWINY
jgi:TolB protein